MFCIFSKFELHRKKNQFVLAWCTQSNLCHRCVASLSHGTKSYSLLNLKTTHLDVSFFLQYITGRILVAYWSRAMVKKSKDCENFAACKLVFNATSYLQTIYHHLLMASQDKFSILFTNLLSVHYILWWNVKKASKCLQRIKHTITLLELEMTAIYSKCSISAVTCMLDYQWATHYTM